MKLCLTAAVLVAALLDAGCRSRSPYRYDPFTQSPAPLAPPQVSPGTGAQPYGTTTIQPSTPGTVQPYGTPSYAPQSYVPSPTPIVISPSSEPAASGQGTNSLGNVPPAPTAPSTSATGFGTQPLASSPPTIVGDDQPAFGTASADWESPATRSFDTAAPLPDDLVSQPPGSGTGVSPVTQASASESEQDSATGARNPYAHAPDYGWLRGVLQRDAAAGVWTLRYAPEDAQGETYGGVVTLGSFDDPRLEEFEAGDVVLVTGSIDSSGGSGTPTYILRSIQRLR